MEVLSAKIFTHKLRGKAIVLLLAAFILIYLGTNHIALRAPLMLPLFDWEKGVPFLPWTIFFYFLAYLQVVGLLVLITRRSLRRVLLGLLGIIIVHGLVFLLLPTYYPRPSFPSETSSIVRMLYTFLIALDSPQNCFPSLHVAMSLFATFVFWRQSRYLGLVSWLLATLTIVSTLTLKQHYFVDIIGGFLVAVPVYFFLFHPYVSHRKSAKHRLAN